MNAHSQNKFYQRAYQRLRSLRPHEVHAIVDGEQQQISLPKGRGKWERALDAARALNAEGLQLYDAEGGIIEIIALCEPTSTSKRDEDDDEQGEDEDRFVKRYARLLTIALDANDRALLRQSEHQQQVLDAAVRIMQVATERVQHLERALTTLVRQQERLLEDKIRGGKGDLKDDVMALLAAAQGSGIDVGRFMSAAAKGELFDVDDVPDVDEAIDASPPNGKDTPQ